MFYQMMVLVKCNEILALCIIKFWLIFVSMTYLLDDFVLLTFNHLGLGVLEYDGRLDLGFPLLLRAHQSGEVEQLVNLYSAVAR